MKGQKTDARQRTEGVQKGLYEYNVRYKTQNLLLVIKCYYHDLERSDHIYDTMVV